MQRRYKTDAELLAECAALDLCYATAADDEREPVQGDWIVEQDREDDPGDLLRDAALSRGQP